MRVATSFGELTVEWKHYSPGSKATTAVLNGPRVIGSDWSHGWTECYVQLPGQARVLYGVAKVHPRDNFNKREGRLVSLRKVAKKLPKQDRPAIFAAFFAESA